MDCDAVTRALSEDDGRVIRRRDVRAHLRSCAGCSEFRDGIKSRRQDFAALASLPTVAAAGMLQGLVGGGTQAASGGGVAAALGGGAAKTIATSAVVKSVATVAVVAAVGVTAADRTGAIHLGLPGEQSARSAPAEPGVAHHDAAAPGQSAAGGTIGAGRSPAANGAGGRPESKHGAAPASNGHGHRARGANPHGAEAQGPPVEQAGGRSEKELPSAAAGGQEKAAGNQAESGESSSGGNGKAPEAPPGKPSSHPGNGPSNSPPEESPANPPQGAAPSLPPQAHQPTPPGREAEPPAAGTPSNPGKGVEKGQGG